MHRIAKGLVALAVGVGLAAPVKALTEEEALGISLGVKVLTCIIAEGCPTGHYHPVHHHNQPHYRNYHNRYTPNYRYPQYRYNHPQHNNSYFNQHHHNLNDRYFNQHHRNFNNRNSYPSQYYGRENYHRQHQDVRGQINHIYREVLRRDADHGGLSTYQDRYNNGWSLQDIRRDIENSYEARQLRGY